MKYPRTHHIPTSEGATNDDKILKDLSHFINKYVIFSEKMDGENTTLTRIKTYARSLDSLDHPSRHWVKGLWGNIKHNIPIDWRICGENLYAKHSIEYNDLLSYFMVFSIWNDENICLNIDETLEWCELLNLTHVPIIWRGKFDLDVLKNIKIDTEKQEGFVIRLADEFKYKDFNKSVAKWVRKDHIETDEHWMYSKIIPNKLKI